MNNPYRPPIDTDSNGKETARDEREMLSNCIWIVTLLAGVCFITISAIASIAILVNDLIALIGLGTGTFLTVVASFLHSMHYERFLRSKR